MIHWIAFEKLQTTRSDICPFIISYASAKEQTPPELELAQTETQVICRLMLSAGKILRRIREGDSCYDETINT